MSTALSPKALGEAIGVSESSIKRWVDEGRIAAFRTAGGHRRIRVSEALRAVREGGYPVLRPELLGLPKLRQADAGEPLDLLDATLADALMDGRGEEVRATLFGAWLAGASVAELLDGPVAAAMRKIGALWRHDAEGILVEHRATDLCEQTLHIWRGMLPPPPADAPVAVGGALAGDNYSLPSLMAATVIAAEGMREINLSKETPADTLARAAARYEARLVWIAMSVDLSDELHAQHVREIEALAAQVAATGGHLVLGGRAVPDGFADRQREHIHVMHAFTELADLVRDILPG
jgi:excisionase family DNA binding protein